MIQKGLSGGGGSEQRGKGNLDKGKSKCKAMLI